MEIFNVQKIYEGYNYPEEFLRIVDLNLVNLDFWYLMTREEVEIRIEGLKIRYAERSLIPFARRDDCDDIACFEVGKGNKVQIVHDFASAGYEQRKEYSCFWDWFKDAIEEMIQGEDQL
ncbi:MAG: hypothetical protein Q4F83_02965 [Eubacteriales bacterium]|nr:hypothetical protein [Eubacteriales bacterium]